MASFWDFVPALITAGAAVYGAKQATDAGNRAATIETNAQNKGTAAQLAGLDTAKGVYATNSAAASPGLMAEQAIINRGAALTPEQEQAVADSRGQVINSLEGSGLRGSARATSAMIADTDSRVRNNFMTQNQGAANSAAQALSGQYFAAGQGLAGAATGQGNAISQGLIANGQVYGDNTIGQAKVQGQAIGDVGALVASTIKTQAQKNADALATDNYTKQQAAIQGTVARPSGYSSDLHGFGV